jgi:two-component system sensor histidine kinase KdpD
MKTAVLVTRPVVRYLLAALVIVLTTALVRWWQPDLGTALVPLLYLLPVGLCTAILGLGPGIVSAVLAFLAFNYFFIEPFHTLTVSRAEDTAVLLVFLVVAVVISQLVGRAQAGLVASQAREREASLLYELSTALAGLMDAQGIGQTLCEQIRQTFRARRVELEVRGVSDAASLEAAAAEAEAPADGPAHEVMALQTARGRLGEIRLWLVAPPLAPSEARLLYTFASQGALALERAWLAQAEQRARVLEESDRLKSALLSSVSHELRTPLATIKAAATSLRSGEIAWDSAARRDLLGAIDDEADHLNRLVGNLLDMSRIESGALRPRRQWNLLAEIVAGVVQRMQPQAADHVLEIDVPENLPLVPVDYVQLEQVFTNLISNGLKYAPPRSTISIRASLEASEAVRVHVSNQGPPVPEQDLARIFDKFYRVTAAERVTGTGLGLSICKGIVEAHGGRIWAENLPHGFAFVFTLPLTWDGAPPPRVPVEGESAG